MFEKRINIFTGHYGSGKSEVAVNYAFKMNKKLGNVAIVDLDIVNPYFRTADARERLEAEGIKVMAPLYANTNVDAPTLPVGINSVFENKAYNVVLDVGGDEVGSTVLGRYNEEISENAFEMFMVINTLRPFTNTPEKILEMLAEIEWTSKLEVTALINNTNYLASTTVDIILEGHKIIQIASEKANIPIAFISGFNPMAKEAAQQLNIEHLPLQKNILLPF